MKDVCNIKEQRRIGDNKVQRKGGKKFSENNEPGGK